MRVYSIPLSFLTCFLTFALIDSPDAHAACVNADFDANAVANQPMPTTTPYDGWAGVDVDGVKRPFCLVIPPSYDGSRQVPLILMFHGGKGSAQRWREERSDLLQLVGPEGVVVAFAQGYRFPKVMSRKNTSDRRHGTRSIVAVLLSTKMSTTSPTPQPSSTL